MAYKYVQILLLKALTLVASYNDVPPDTVSRLLANLTTGYDRRVRPTYYQEHEHLVLAMAFPYSLMELSTEAQRLSMVIFFSIQWQDQLLVWNATEYDEIKKLTFNIEEIWYPKLMINPAYSEQLSYIRDDVGQAAVHSNGTVMWIPGTSVSVLCDVDITFYPFDTQKCPILIYEPFASQDEIKLKAIPFDVLGAVYHPNQEWHLLEILLTETVIGGSDTIVYTYVFRRRAEFVVYTTILPLILLTTLNACVLLVPVSSGEKGSIAVTLFLSYCVYLTAIEETLPPNSLNASLLLIYMTIVVIFSGLVMLYSIIQTRMYIHGSTILLSCYCRNRIQSKTEKGDNHNGDTSEPEIPKSADKHEADTDSACDLARYRKLDNIAFLVCFVLNATIVAVFAVMIANNLRETVQ